jgi:hypothetical protein
MEMDQVRTTLSKQDPGHQSCQGQSGPGDLASAGNGSAPAKALRRNWHTRANEDRVPQGVLGRFGEPSLHRSFGLAGRRRLSGKSRLPASRRLE